MDSPPMPLRFVKSVNREFTSRDLVTNDGERMTTRVEPGSENRWVFLQSHSQREREQFCKWVRGGAKKLERYLRLES